MQVTALSDVFTCYISYIQPATGLSLGWPRSGLVSSASFLLRATITRMVIFRYVLFYLLKEMEFDRPTYYIRIGKVITAEKVERATYIACSHNSTILPTRTRLQ